MLTIGSRYNASLVWKELAEETQRAIQNYRMTSERRFDTYDNIEDLEYACVLASGGKMDAVDRLVLREVDVSGTPSTIINNLVKIVRGKIFLKKVGGWSTSMLNDAKCEKIFISEMKLEPGSEMRPFMVSESVELQHVHGDICGFLEQLPII